MASLKQVGIPAADIRSLEFSASPEYGWFGNKPNSYKVINMLVVRVADERLFQAVAAVADRYKEVQLAETAFEHSQKDQAEERVSKAALAKIMAEKQLFERELGLRLRPVSFGTQRASDRDGFGEIVVTASKVGASTEPESFELPEGFDEIEYRARVSVTFEVTKAD